jgi:hypothetical protein
LGSWSSGEDGYKVQEIGEGEVIKQDFKWPAANMEKKEMKVRRSLIAQLHLVYDVVH